MAVETRSNLRVKILVGLTAISVLLVLLTGYTKYIYAGDYFFIIEAPCDENSQTCFVRDCEDYCPPNELATYKTYLIKAEDFADCTENSCTNICENEETSDLCEEVICNLDNGDDCSL